MIFYYNLFIIIYTSIDGHHFAKNRYFLNRLYQKLLFLFFFRRIFLFFVLDNQQSYSGYQRNYFRKIIMDISTF